MSLYLLILSVLPAYSFYQWHATTSQADEKWTEAVFTKAFDGKPFDQVYLV